LKRLPLYHRFLKEWQAAGRETVSCTDIGSDLDLDPTQVRKDLESVGVVGRPRIGYVLTNVTEELERFLGWNNINDAFLVGAGSMGSALLGYRKFEQCGLKIVTAFDLDPSKIGTKIHGKHVLPLEKAARILRGACTFSSASSRCRRRRRRPVADLMVEGGIRAIWNFAPIRLHTPEHVIVHNEDLYCSLAALSQKLFATLQIKPRKTGPKSKTATTAALSN
jgi:redox-sensing transcriptional repressor